METSENPETPTAMQRLEQTEGEVRRMTGDISSLVQLGHQQQQQFHHHQQQIQQQEQQLAQILQMLTNMASPSAHAPAPSAHTPAPATTATAPSAPSLLSAPASFQDPNVPVPGVPVPGVPVPAAPVPVALSAHEPKIGNPERFDGNPAQVRAFLTSCRVQFSLQPRTFSTEGARVGYVITHLTGRARLWGTAEFDRQTPACASFDAFAKEMLKVFDLDSSTAEASRALMTIRQGNRTVADFSIDFRTLARRSSWNEAAQVDAFLHSLADYVKDELVSHDQPSTLDETIALAVRIDRRIQTRRREKGRSTQTSVRTLSHSVVRPPSSATPQSQLDPPEPMEIGRASLTPAERQRRISSNLCLYCGGENHRVASCPAKAAAHRT